MKVKIALIGKGNWARHFGEFNGNSKIEKECFDYIKCNINNSVQANVPIENYIVDIFFKNKIVEFYGDFWHANPKMFNSDDLIKSFSINKLAKEIWEIDAKRIGFLKSLGYDVLIVWENDWKKNKEEVVNLLKKFYESNN